MGKHPYRLLLIFSLVLSLGLLSFVFCIIAESNKTKIEDVKIDDKLCYLPESHATKYGYVALASAVIAQIIGSSVFFSDCCTRRNENSSKYKRPKIATIILGLSWISFVIAVILLSTATSMSKKQAYGKGWLEQECYLVKDGVYIGSGVAVLLSTVGTLGSAILPFRKWRNETAPKIIAQV